MIISAPGKIFFIGEYAVLEGAWAVVAAVQRRVYLERGGGRMRPLVAMGRRAACEWLERPDLAEEIWLADSRELYVGRKKLGLGSSAAVAVGAVASVFAEAGLSVEDKRLRKQIWAVACDVHDSWQRTKGSGADVAAAVFGGIFAYRRSGERDFEEKLWSPPRAAKFFLVWTGKISDTRSLVRAVRAIKARNKMFHAKLVRDMSACTQTFIEKGSSCLKVLFSCLQQYNDLMDALGRAAGIEVVGEFERFVAKVAGRFGGASKPCGAGGGDMVLVALPSEADIGKFTAAFEEAGAWVFEVGIDCGGVRVEQGAHGGIR